ncbi:MAG: excinuclease ABC subunit UvrA [Alistipes sp.]|nr:excinuclease ABC subunit UvrA [Alistipes sp.]
MALDNKITIKGARVHNLKNIDLEIPHNKLVVVTGLSGSGKSTLAFDTIFAEGQRRYVESLSAYARQFLGRVEKPDVDIIDGIAPAIAIEQKVISRNPRSTVGTSTEIYDYLKLLFARIGRTYSPTTGREIRCYEVDDVVDYLLTLDDDTRIVVAAPMLLKQSEGIVERMLTLIEDGVNRVIYRDEVMLVEEFMPKISGDMLIDDVMIVVDRLKVSHEQDTVSRMADSVARAMGYGSGVMYVQIGGRYEQFSTHYDEGDMTFERPTEHLFSFNNPLGACPMCEGYGKVMGIDEDLVVPDKSKSVYDGAVACWNGASMSRWKQELVLNSSKCGFPIHTPYHALTQAQRDMLWHGTEYFYGIDQFFEYVDTQRHKVQYRALKSRYVGKTTCPECHGSRLRKEALYVKIGGRNIAELVQMTIGELITFFDNLNLDEHDATTAERVLKEIRSRLGYLVEVGLHYLTLDRLSATLSGGESQRINLSTSLGSNLVGSMYILDEPSIGLHPRDTDRLIGVLKQLRDLDNTVIVVEHEEEVMRAADWIVDMGPEAGVCGGEVVYNGPASQIYEATDSLTADYLTHRKEIAIPARRRAKAGSVKIYGARHNNLKNIDVEIPLGVLTCITGVSGSGKSSLADDILYPALKRRLSETTLTPGDHDRLEVDNRLVQGVEMVSQSPIGKSTRSNPVTYIKAYDEIRKLFAEQPYCKHTGITPAAFSFNMPGGRCEECEGEGVIKISMQFMADVELQCEACQGRRFKPEILEVKYRGKTIYDVLEMSVDEAIKFFMEDDSNSTVRRIVERIRPLQQVGLGYVKLGQSSSTLSGGESQRVKLASFLTKDKSSEHLIFIFDEPTTGLHFHDIRRLLGAFDALIERGHSVVVVEHNMEVIKCADWVIDLGPEAGVDGGRVVVAGTPEEVEACAESYTGQYLKIHNERV